MIVNLEDKKIKRVNHNLKILEDGQGGLLEVLYYEEKVYVSYSENRGNGNSSTSVAVANFSESNLDFRNIFRAEPPINSGYHFGSRMVIKDNFLFITAGERGKGMIAQDPTKHPGSIIRIHLDGKIPKDNPKFKNKEDWLPEIFQIGGEIHKEWIFHLIKKFILPTWRRGEIGLRVRYGENYGWKILGWGGKNYSGTTIDLNGNLASLKL